MKKAQKPLKIYIASPYTGNTDEQIRANVNAAIDASFKLFAKGHFPYVPHLTHFIDQRAKEIGMDLKWEDYIKWDMVWVQACDALLYLGSSKGADIELQAAKEWGKQIFYTVDEIPPANRDEPNTYSQSSSRVPRKKLG